MSEPRQHRYVARVTIEFTTPFHVGAGREGEISDAAVVTDANGLPAIPGSSLAGVLRATYTTAHGPATAREIFGHQDSKRRNGTAADSHGSRLTVSWACLHNRNNRPVEGVVAPGVLSGDPVLLTALAPTLRDHVRIGHRGAAATVAGEAGTECGVGGHGKFDELAVCAGHRFTFELELAGSGRDVDAWHNLLDLLWAPGLRIGGKSRRGFGAFTIVALRQGSFDLATKEGFQGYANHPVSFTQPDRLVPYTKAATSTSTVTATLNLAPEGYWMFGGGVDAARDGGTADMAPVRDRRIRWDSSAGGQVKESFSIPGSAVKGALAHRVAYHCNRIAGRFADRHGIETDKCVGSANEAVCEFFGRVSDKRGGQRGVVLIDDCFLETEPPSQFIHHVSLDRFTGGARAGFLFNERPLWKGQLRLRLFLVGAERVSTTSRQALSAALQDLAQGRLQLGAGSGRGLGFFTALGGVEWSDDGVWVGKGVGQ